MSEKAPKKSPFTFKKPRKLAVFLAAVLVITGGMLAVAMHLYDSSGTASLDLSLPSYNNERSQIDWRDDENADMIAPTGELNKTDAEEYQRKLKTKTDQIDQIEGFSPASLDDKNIGLTPVGQ